MRELLALRPERLLAYLLASHALITAWHFSGSQACIDYYQFWVVGRAARAGEMREIYSDAERRRIGETAFQRALAEARSEVPPRREPTRHLLAAQQRRVLETYSTPSLYAVVGAFSLADYERSQDAFERASLLAFLAAVVLLARFLGTPPAQLALWCVALLPWFNPVVDDTLVGNVNRLQLFLLVLFLWVESGSFRGRHVLAGTLLGATLAFKPNLAVAAVVLFLGWAVAGEVRRLVATLSGLLAGVAASVLASSAYFGSFAPWPAWLAEIPKLAAPGAAVAGSAKDGNFSLARLLQDATGIALGPWLAVLLLAAVAIALVRERRERTIAGATFATGRAVLLIGLGAVLSLLAAEPCWQHYYVAVVPLAMVLLRPAEPDGGARPWVRIFAVLGIALVSLQNVGRLLDLQDPRAAAVVLAGGTLLLFVAGLADLARPRAGAP